METRPEALRPAALRDLFTKLSRVEQAVLDHLSELAVVADDQIVHIQQAQIDQFAQEHNADEPAQVDLVGADVVVEVAVLEQVGGLQRADVQRHGGIRQIVLVHEAFFNQIDQCDVRNVQRHEAVQGDCRAHGTGNGDRKRGFHVGEGQAGCR